MNFSKDLQLGLIDVTVQPALKRHVASNPTAEMMILIVKRLRARSNKWLNDVRADVDIVERLSASNGATS